MSGGVALNCVANSLIEKVINPEKFFIQPACEDSGISLGAALLEFSSQSGYKGPCLGCSFGDEEIKSYLDETKIRYKKVREPSVAAANLLAEDKIIGWFQGNMETGPRALGSRSILANPANKDMATLVNTCKGREQWRPFGPSVLENKAPDIFCDYSSSPFMLKSFKVKDKWKSKIRAVVHVDGTTRPQTVNQPDNPVYYRLINEFYKKTDLPLVLNTSFNYAGEPIVCTPADAIRTFSCSNLDALILGNYLINK
jgi:carbamoyltransferase